MLGSGYLHALVVRALVVGRLVVGGYLCTLVVRALVVGGYLCALVVCPWLKWLPACLGGVSLVGGWRLLVCLEPRALLVRVLGWCGYLHTLVVRALVVGVSLVGADWLLLVYLGACALLVCVLGWCAWWLAVTCVP